MKAASGVLILSGREKRIESGMRNVEVDSNARCQETDAVDWGRSAILQAGGLREGASKLL